MHCKLLTQLLYAIIMVQFLAELRKIKLPAGHCKRSEGKVVSDLVTWHPTQGRRSSAGCPTETYVIGLLHEDMGFNTNEIQTCMQNRSLWRAIIGVRQKTTE